MQQLILTHSFLHLTANAADAGFGRRIIIRLSGGARALRNGPLLARNTSEFRLHGCQTRLIGLRRDRLAIPHFAPNATRPQLLQGKPYGKHVLASLIGESRHCSTIQSSDKINLTHNNCWSFRLVRLQSKYDYGMRG